MTHAKLPRRTGPDADPGETPAALAVTPVAAPRGSPRLAAGFWLVAAFVLIALLKPWGGGGRVAATLLPDVAGPAEITPEPTEDRSAVGLAEPVCLGAGAWRIATLETWRARSVRVWRAIEPVGAATGPLDPSIPAVPVAADVLTGLGWCAPAYGSEQPIGPAHVRAWQVVDGAAHEVALRQVQPADGVTPIAALYLPATGAWTSGRVVFEYRDDGTGALRWLAADLQIAALAPGPSAGASPAASSPAPSSP